MQLLAAQFRRFAEAECHAAPLYRHLTAQIATDEALLALADQGTGGPKPNLLLAAVQYLLLKGAAHPLRDFYRTLTRAPLSPEQAFGPFREFSLSQATAIRALITTRRVQTNEVARAALLLPGFGQLSRWTGERPLALIEVGTSAGLLLRWDRYAYDYGGGITWGSPDSPLRLHCQWQGVGPAVTHAPPLPPARVAIASRVGIDLNPVDLTDPDALLWLRALVWPDQPERAERLIRAAALAAADRLPVWQGDALALLPDALAAARAGTLPALPCVFHAFTLNQFPLEGRERFLHLLAEQSLAGPVGLLSLESANVMPMPGRPAHPDTTPELWASLFEGGRLSEQCLLARCEAHGAWIRWQLPT